MQEYDYRAEAARLAQFITPPKLREFVARKVNRRIDKNTAVVFDPAVGSGQLLEFIECRQKIGADIDAKSLEQARQNGIEVTDASDFITTGALPSYTTAVSNYPFGIAATPEQKDFLERNCPQFCNGKGKFVGVLDFVFILKSFLTASDNGFYLCFPGIAYRQNEKRYRDFIFENRYLKELGLVKNCKFSATGIDVLYMELSKAPNDSVQKFVYDLNADSYSVQESVEYASSDDIFRVPSEPMESESIEFGDDDNFELVDLSTRNFLTLLEGLKLLATEELVSKRLAIRCFNHSQSLLNNFFKQALGEVNERHGSVQDSRRECQGRL